MVTIFYDSLCPVCNAEVGFLKNFDKKNQIRFVDITKASFKPEQYNRTLADFIGTIHGLNQAGELVTGLSVFRDVYNAVGLGWVLNWTQLPGLKLIAETGYRLFAKVRPRFSKFKPCEDRCKI